MTAILDDFASRLDGTTRIATVVINGVAITVSNMLLFAGIIDRV
jgi:hypothetical protein